MVSFIQLIGPEQLYAVKEPYEPLSKARFVFSDTPHRPQQVYTFVLLTIFTGKSQYVTTLQLL